MRIDGKAFLLLLGVGTLALAAATVWLWPRLAGSGAKALIGRSSLLLGTQLALAATFLFAVNAWGGFYTSWGQLFGTASAKYSVTDRGAADAGQYDAKALDGVARWPRASRAGLSGARLSGLRSGLDAGLQIYPPADYATRRDEHRRFPVEIVDLTGGAAGLSAATYQQVANTYQVMVAVVTSSVQDIPGVDVPDGRQGRLFWAQDLQAALTAHYRLDPYAPDWGIAGVGPDGTAAVNLAVQDPSHYGLAAAAGDWTHTDPQQSWPGIGKYLASVPTPNISLLYDPSAGAIPQRLRATSGALKVTRQRGLTLLGELDWLGQTIDANADARA
ncbi:hypothetical protein [Actinospica robiniae]|uniref:hypothetical protein n=1 Tax=Actinospica robiniae TaxID=304901 RepID=UPI0003F57AF9|nr:hypothetical protein [Actinospica robiniae]